MDYGRDNRFSFWRRLTSGGFGHKKKDQSTTTVTTAAASTTASSTKDSGRRWTDRLTAAKPPSGSAGRYFSSDLRRGRAGSCDPAPVGRHQERAASEQPVTGTRYRSPAPSSTSASKPQREAGGGGGESRSEAGRQSYLRTRDSAGEAAGRARGQGLSSVPEIRPPSSSYSFWDSLTRSGRYRDPTRACSVPKEVGSTKDVPIAHRPPPEPSPRFSSGYTRRASVERERSAEREKEKQEKREKRTSLQFYYDPGKLSVPSTSRDLSGVRSIYTSALQRSADERITGSGRRAPSSSTYRPLVYTPGSPSPLRRSWNLGGSSDRSSSPSRTATADANRKYGKDMASFMAIGRNSVFPDFLSSSRSAGHGGHATHAYQESHQDTSALEGLKQKTLRLFGNNNNNTSHKGATRSNSFSASSSSTSATRGYTSGSQSSYKAGSPSASNGNGSRSIYRQPPSVAQRNRNQGADLRRKYFSQRMKWYSEADEDYVNEELERQRTLEQRRHHSATELASSASNTDLLRSDLSGRVSPTPSPPISAERIAAARSAARERARSRGSILKSASFDYYDNLDYKSSRDNSPSSPIALLAGVARGRRASTSTLPPSMLRQKSGSPKPQRRAKSLRTRFSDDVAIIYYDQGERATSVSSGDTERRQEKLKDDRASSSTVTEGTVRLACTLHKGRGCGYSNVSRLLAVSANMAAALGDAARTTTNPPEAQPADAPDGVDPGLASATENGNVLPPPPAPEEEEEEEARRPENPGPCELLDAEGNLLRKPVFRNKTFDIVAVTDNPTTDTEENDDDVGGESGDASAVAAAVSYEVRLVVPIGCEFIRNRTSVKATSGGKRLIVIAYRYEGEGEREHLHQYIEKMTLPHPIDAYSVRATMDRDGNLKISAPVSVYEPPPVPQAPAAAQQVNED